MLRNARRSRRLLATIFGALALMVAIYGVVAGGVQAAGKGGNSENAKKCQKGGYTNYFTSDGTAFATEEECVSYAAQGGQLQPRRTWTNVGPTLFDLISPDLPPYVEGTDYLVMSGSGSGDVTGRLQAIDVSFSFGGPQNTNPYDTSTSGCEQGDYAGFQVGAIALVQRGTCTLQQKVDLAVANGASAVIIFNEGQSGRTTADFGDFYLTSIPVLTTRSAVGYELYNRTLAGPVTARVVTNTTYQ